MKIYLIRDGVFTLSGGKPASNLLGYDSFSKRYLAAFDEVVMVGRLFHREDPSGQKVEGPGVSFLPMPGYHGPLGFLKNIPRLLRTIWNTLDPQSAYALRIPATIPSIYAILLWLKGIPFTVEVVADPYDGYSKKALDHHPLADVFRFFFVKLTQWQCRKAVASSYVTREALQRRYPPGNPAGSFAFTDIDLTPDTYIPTPRKAGDFNIQKPRLVIIGNMQKSLKGHDTLLQAVHLLKSEGYPTHLTIIGFGENQPQFEAMARDLGLAEDVTFTGKLQTGDPIRKVLDASDLFVLPSRQEGLPRALLEAMSRGLPCIASRIGGNAELLQDDSLIQPDDVPGLAARIKAFAFDADLLARHSARSLDVAHRYNVEDVTQTRLAFFHYVRSVSGK